MSVIMEIMVFLSKRPNGPKKPALLGKHHWIVYEGGFWSVYWMSVAIRIVVLLFSSHLVFVTKSAPTGDSTHKDELHSARHLAGVMEAAPFRHKRAPYRAHFLYGILDTGCWILDLSSVEYLARNLQKANSRFVPTNAA